MVLILSASWYTGQLYSSRFLYLFFLHSLSVDLYKTSCFSFFGCLFSRPEHSLPISRQPLIHSSGLLYSTLNSLLLYWTVLAERENIWWNEAKRILHNTLKQSHIKAMTIKASWFCPSNNHLIDIKCIYTHANTLIEHLNNKSA